MLKLQNFPFHTLKTAPKGSENKSTALLLQGSYIRQAMAGTYEFLPIGYRVLKNIENIVREEMDKAGYHEMLMTILTPREIWEKTGRWEVPEYFKVPAWGNSEYRISPTNEENVTPIMNEFIQSYKDLPTCVYHIQKKFRNEKRAKSGLLRGREFHMKDAYSFHKDIKDFEIFYEDIKKVYMRVFERLGLGVDTVIADADGGAISDKNSHEFQVKLEVGEDLIFHDKISGETYNKEIAPSKVGKENISETEMKEREDIKAEGVIGVEALSKKLGIPAEKTIKTMMYEADSKFIVAAVRGDYEINTIKLQKILKVNKLELASAEIVLEKTGTEIGYAGIINLDKNIAVYLDDSIKGLTNFETGTNKTGYHSININFGRDLEEPKKFYDFKEAKTGDKNPKTGEIYEVFKASEVGNIFHLGTKYSKPFGLSYLDENNKMVDKVEMGCYGIGVSRLMGVMAEYFMTDSGIAWPENVAPYDYYIIVIGEENLEKAEELGRSLEKMGKSVILDNRMGKKFGFGQKAGDSDLWGIPNRIVISKKTLEQGGYELKKRGEKEEIVEF